MSLTVIYGDRGSDLLALASNLKVCIGALVFQGGIQVELGEDESHTGLKDLKTGFRLLESNAIVKYLAKDFKRTEAIEFEETKLYKALKSNQKEQIMALSDLLTDFADNQEITAYFRRYMLLEVRILSKKSGSKSLQLYQRLKRVLPALFSSLQSRDLRILIPEHRR